MFTGAASFKSAGLTNLLNGYPITLLLKLGLCCFKPNVLFHKYTLVLFEQKVFFCCSLAVTITWVPGTWYRERSRSNISSQRALLSVMICWEICMRWKIMTRSAAIHICYDAFAFTNLYLQRNMSSQRSRVILFSHCVFNRSCWSLFLGRGLITSYVSLTHFVV